MFEEGLLLWLHKRAELRVQTKLSFYFSYNVVTNVLQKELGFQGLILQMHESGK
jgi:hypothetical protein